MNIKQAKQIPLDALLSHLGYKPTKQIDTQSWYLSPLRSEKTPSFKVNRVRNLWYDFGTGQGGDILDLMRQIEKQDDVPTLLRRIANIMGSRAAIIIPMAQDAAAKSADAITVTSIDEVKSHVLKSYLKRRGIAPSKVASYVKEAHYSIGNKQFYAIAFANDDGGFELRNPWFKGSLGKKAITTLSGASDDVLLFEGYFDFLSYVMRSGRPTATVIVLNSVNMVQHAIDNIGNRPSRSIHVFADNDSAGKHMLQDIQSAFPQRRVVDESVRYAGFKDLNDWHCAEPSRDASRITKKPLV